MHIANAGVTQGNGQNDGSAGSRRWTLRGPAVTSVTVRSVPGYSQSLQRIHISRIVDGNGLAESLYGVLKYIGAGCEVSTRS